jgi:hypothetical protein
VPGIFRVRRTVKVGVDKDRHKEAEKRYIIPHKLNWRGEAKKLPRWRRERRQKGRREKQQVLLNY